MKRKENHPREVFYLYCAFCGLRFILFFLIMLFVFRTYPSVSIPCFVGDGMFLILIRELLSPNGISRSFFQMCYSTISVVHFIYPILLCKQIFSRKVPSDFLMALQLGNKEHIKNSGHLTQLPRLCRFR